MEYLQVEKHEVIVVWSSFEYFIEFSRLSELFANFGHQSVHKARRGTLKEGIVGDWPPELCWCTIDTR